MIFITYSALFQDADTDESGTVSFDELQAELEKYPDIIENLTIRLVLLKGKVVILCLFIH